MQEESISYWKDLCFQLQAQLQEVRTENALLKSELEKLKEKLNTNSSNSLKPPSQDPFRRKPDPKSSGKKRGG